MGIDNTQKLNSSWPPGIVLTMFHRKGEYVIHMFYDLIFSHNVVNEIQPLFQKSLA